MSTSHVYQRPGGYNWSVTIRDQSGATDGTIGSVVVTRAPLTRFGGYLARGCVIPILEHLEQGAPAAPITQDAKAALERLARKQG